MPLFATLRDDFSVDTLPTNWPASSGATITGGRLRVTCDTAFNGGRSDDIYTLTGSKVCAEVYPAAAGGATVEAATELLVQTTTAGTDAGFSYNAFTGNLVLASRVGFFDGSAVTLTYSSTTHRWWRLREDAGTLYWETSPDGDVWTVRRSAAAPSWVSDTTLTASMTCHRNDGTNDVAEFDNFNNATIRGTAVAAYAFTGTALGVRTVVGVAAGALIFTGTGHGVLTAKGRAEGAFTFSGTARGVSSATIYPTPAPKARWQILTGPASGGYEQELTVARGRRLTMRLTSPSDLSFEMNARHGEAYNIDELSTDTHVRWISAEGVRWILFRGRVMSSSDAGDEGQHRTAFVSHDYRAVLTRRRLWHGQSLNLNDSFEDGPGSWSGTGGTFEVVDDQAQDRTKSGRITPDGVTATVKIASANFGVTAGTPYRLSAWLRNAVARPLTAQVDWKDGGGATLSSSSITKTVAAETWTHYNGDAVAPVGATQASVVGLMTGTPPVTDIMWMDDARLTALPNIASLLTFDGTDQAAIAWALVNDTQVRTGGNLGISNGTTPTGVPRDRTFQIGDSVGELIQQLSETLDGFDWDITPTPTSASGLQLSIWHPQRGVNRGVVLTPGGLIQSWRREVQSSTYGNALRFTGAETTIPVEDEAVDLATRAEGRWDVVIGDSGLTTQHAVDERADWQLVQSQTVRPTYTIKLARDAWLGPDHIWLGDPVQVVIFSGRLTVNTVLRVYEMTFTLDEDDGGEGGGATVDIVLGGPKGLDPTQWPAHQDRRIATLERR